MINKKKIIILILCIILFSGYVLIKNNDKIGNNSIDNTSCNDNMSLNTIDNSSNKEVNLSNIKDNFSNSNHVKYNYSHAKKYKTKSDDITGDDILKIVRKGVWWEDSNGKDTQDVRLGKPYKSKGGLWLVGAFDKKIGKFLGSVWVGPDGGGFFWRI